MVENKDAYKVKVEAALDYRIESIREVIQVMQKEYQDYMKVESYWDAVNRLDELESFRSYLDNITLK